MGAAQADPGSCRAAPACWPARSRQICAGHSRGPPARPAAGRRASLCSLAAAGKVASAVDEQGGAGRVPGAAHGGSMAG